MPKWDEITKNEKYQNLPPEARAQLKTEWFKANLLPEIESKPSLKEMGVEKVYEWFMQQPDDTGQGYVTSMLGAAGRGFGEMVPGAIEGVGALTGSEGLREFGQEVRGGLEDISPVNPIYGESIPVKLSELGGQIGSVLATAGAGGLAGKALGGVGAVSKGAQTAALGSAFLQGSAEGAREAEQYGMSGPEAYLRTLAGGATEAGTELLPFGMAAETSLAKRLLTGAPRTGTFLGAVGSEAGEEGLGQIASNIATKTLAPAGVETPDITAGALEAAAYGAAGGAMLGGVNALISTPPERQTQIQKDLQAEAGAIPKDTVPDQTNEEKMAAMEKGGVTVVSPDGKTAVIAPEPSMPDPTEVAKTIGDASVEQLAATGNKASAAAQKGFNAILAETLDETAEPTIQPEQAAEDAGAEVMPSSGQLAKVEEPWQIKGREWFEKQRAKGGNLASDLSRAMNQNADSVISSGQSFFGSFVDKDGNVDDGRMSAYRAIFRSKGKDLVLEKPIGNLDKWKKSGVKNFPVVDFAQPQTPSPAMEMPSPPQGVDMASASVSPIITGAPLSEGAERVVTPEEESLAAKRRADLLSSAADVAKGKKKAQVSPAVTTMVTPKPVETQEDATREIPLEESVREEPQDRIESREAEEAILGDSLLRPAEGEVKEEVMPLPEVAADPFAATPLVDNLPALIAVRDNNATPEQVQSLVDQGLVEQVDGQNIITEAGVAAMPEDQRPKLTPTERAAEVEGMVAPGGVATERDLSKPEQMTPREFVPIGNPVNQGIFKSKKEASARLAELEETISKSQQMKAILAEFGLLPQDAYQVAKDSNGRWSLGATHKHRIALAAKEKSPVSADAVDTYNIKLPEGYVKQGDLYVFQPQTTKAAETQTPESVAVDSGAAGVVQSEPVEGSIPTVEKVSPETESESRGNLPAIEQIDRLVQSGAKPEEMDKFVKSLSDDQFNELVASEAFDVEPKLAIKPKDTYDAKRIKRRKFVDAVNASTKDVRKTAQQVFQEEEAAAKKQEKLEQDTKSSLNSVVGPQKKNDIQGTVTKADVEAARAALTNSGEIPNAYLTNVYESREAFLADRMNSRLFPASYARLQTEKNIEGLFENGQTLVFAKEVQVSDLDRGLAKMLGVSDEQAAARRVIAHENGHRAISLFTMAEKRDLRGYLMRAYSEEQIAKLVERYTEYADWRTNPESRLEALEELLMRDFERMEKIPTGGVWDDIVQFLKRVWRRLTGQKGEPTLKNLKDVVRLMRNAMKRPAVPLGSFRLKDGGEVKLSIRAFHGTPHKVDKFSLSKIGTGEGAQAYGWGLYFAEALGVAEGYRRNLSFKETKKQFLQALPEDADFSEVMDMLGTGKFTGYQERVIRELDKNGWLGFDYPSQAISAAYRDIQNFDPTPELVSAIEGSGNLYTVELLPDADEFLDWDKPLSEQSEKVKDILPRIGILARGKAYGWKDNLPMGEAYRQIAGDFESDQKASEELAKAGIPGIRYLDGGSRPANVMDARLLQVFEQNNYDVEKTVAQMMRSVYNTPKQKEAIAQSYREQLERGKPTRNYVIFDENLVRILEENGQSLTPPEGSDIRFSRPQFSSDTSAAFSAGSEAARSTLYSERDMDIREAIRRAYESMPKTNSVAVPIGELFAKTEELMQGVTQEEFSLVLQDLFEDNGAVLQEGGSEFIVTTPEGKRAGFVVVMPRAAKASRIKAEGPAVSKLQEDVRNIDEGSVKADFEGRQFTDTKPNQRTVKPKQSYTDAAVEFVDSLQNEGNSLEDIAYSIQSPEFIEGLGIERDLSMQDAIGLEVRNRINNALRKEKAPSVKARLNKLNLSLSKFWQGIGSVKGQHLAIRQKLIADPRYRWMFIKDKAEEAMKEARENVATANITSTDDLTNQMNREGEKADEQSGEQNTNKASDLADDVLMEEGEALLNEENKGIWNSIKNWLRQLAILARIDAEDVKTGSKASKTENEEFYVQMKKLPKEERQKKRDEIQNNINKALKKLKSNLSEAEKASIDGMVEAQKKRGPRVAGQETKADLEIKSIMREMNKARPGQKPPLSKQISWRQIFSQKAKTVEEYRQRIFDAISANEAFQNLSDDKKAKLADLFSEAWESKRKDILERMLTNLINKEEAAKRISQKGAQALREQSQRLVDDINLGILDSDELMKRLAEKFGIKSEFTEEEKQKIDSLIDTLQDSTLNRVKRNKAAYDLLKTLSGTVKVPITKLLADLWVTNVLSGINTMTSIALAVSSGAFELTSGVLRIIKAAIANQKQLPSEISASFKSLARFLGAFPREANLAWQYLVTGDRAFLDPSMNDVLNDLNYDSIGKSVSLAERLAESDKLLEKTVGVWMRTVSRLLTALDSFNSGVTKSGAIPIVARQLELDPATLAKVEESMNLQNYKDRIIRRDFAGVAPKTAREKALVDSWAKDEMMADLDKYGEFTENADFFGQQGAMTLEPSGIGGMIYRLIKSVTGNLSAGSDRFLAESQRKWQERGKSDSMDATRLALAYALQFIAYNSANLAGLRFARFAGNKFNQGLSFIPGIGMLRLFEADLDKTHVKGKDAFMDMIQRNQFAGVMMSVVGLAILKAIADEPDDEKRGWAFNGGWANLTPERKQQKLAAGEKEYTIRVGDKVFNYQNWPISSVLAAIGGLSDLIRYSPEQWNEKSIAGRLGSAAASGVFAASEIPALSQFQELFGSNLSSKDPNEKKLDRFSRVMAGWGGGFVPRILKDFDFLAEPTIKKYDTLWERTASHIPVYRRYVGDDYYDILGKPIERKIYPGSREFMEKPSAPEYQILGKLNSRGIWLTPANAEHRMVGKGRNRRRLTQEEADAYSLETGKGYRQMLLRYGQRALQMPTERARAFLQDKADEVRDRALKKVYRR